MPGNDTAVIKRVGESWDPNRRTDAFLAYVPVHDKSRTGELIAAVNPDADPDNVSGRSPYRAATPLAGIARLNLALNGEGFFWGKTLKEMRDLHLPAGRTARDIIQGGLGAAVGRPLLQLMRDKGFVIGNEQVVTHSSPNQELLDHPPDNAILLIAIPRADRVTRLGRNSVAIDIGCGLNEAGERRGNVADPLRDRGDVIVTPYTGPLSPGHASALFVGAHVLNIARARRPEVAAQLPPVDHIPLTI
jgi:5,10-methylene-tetrahydrofolate dehydrogenase/methenyl tetrahydrofolate cyclohydrolase